MSPASAATSSSTASAVVTPAPPSHLSAAAKQQWTALYAKAHAQAKIDYPENASAQRSAALKAANVLLAVPAPADAAGIANLEPHQVLLRSDRMVQGVMTRICVTTDGRKYSFPIPPPPAPAVEAPAAPAAAKPKK